VYALTADAFTRIGGSRESERNGEAMQYTKAIASVVRAGLSACLALLATAWPALPAAAAEPIKIGFSLSLTGGLAPNGKQLLQALEIWRNDVNARGGLLGRPVDLVYYDDQSSPPSVPGIYTKLLTLDHVDLVLGPYGTNLIAAAMPVLIQAKKLTIGLFGVTANQQFNYPRYFSMISGGAGGAASFSRGWFELAAAQKPKAKTLAIVAADAEFGRITCDGARQNGKAAGFDVVYDKAYPPSTTEFASILRAVEFTHADLIYACAYPPDTVGLVHAAHEIDLKAKTFGGAMIGLFATSIKMQLGPLLNGIVFNENFVPSPKLLDLPGLRELLAKYQATAPALKIDPVGYDFVPFGYAAGQVLAQAVERTKSLDHGKLAEDMHAHAFQTVVGEISFGTDGEWTKPRQFTTQFQNVTGHDVDQFRDTTRQVILWPDEYKTGDMISYDFARKKQP
jgi:branched-chain amino acid transport system substrate-binding protein